MPKNNNLPPKKFPMPIGFGMPVKTEFKNLLEAINVRLINPPKYEDVLDTITAFANATWADKPIDTSKISKADKELIFYYVLKRKMLPTAMETLRLTFTIEGITIQEVTHILRYRKATFSAECSGDKWLNQKDALVPTAIENSPEFYEEYKDLVNKTKELYAKMIDSKCITVQDARYILPRAIETYYYVTMNLNDIIQFLYDRIDKQIQPMADNVIAYRLLSAIINEYPIIAKALGISFLTQPSKFYIETARQNRSTNWYRPDVCSDTFKWNENDFVYKDVLREDINGTDPELAATRKIHQQIYTDTIYEMAEIINRFDRENGQHYLRRPLPYNL